MRTSIDHSHKSYWYLPGQTKRCQKISTGHDFLTLKFDVLEISKTLNYCVFDTKIEFFDINPETQFLWELF